MRGRTRHRLSSLEEQYVTQRRSRRCMDAVVMRARHFTYRMKLTCFTRKMQQKLPVDGADTWSDTGSSHCDGVHARRRGGQGGDRPGSVVGRSAFVPESGLRHSAGHTAKAGEHVRMSPRPRCTHRHPPARRNPIRTAKGHGREIAPRQGARQIQLDVGPGFDARESPQGFSPNSKLR